MSDFQAGLYNTDYYAWTQDQASRLRALAGDNRIDAAHLAEEIEDLGRSELKSLQSYVELILAHLLKIEFSGLPDPVRHWRREIRTFRRRLHDEMTPSLRNRIIEDFDRRYWYGCDAASKAIDDPAFDDRLPERCPYSLDQVLDESWYPEPGVPDD